MFWNKDKIPNNARDEDLFVMDDEKEETVEEIEDNKEENDNIEELSYYEEKENKIIINKVLTIILIIAIVLASMIFIDIILVTRGNTNPLFAIPTKTYKSGTKEYTGIGYKVIKYQEKGGRVDTVVGTWDLKYDTRHIETTALDLSIVFHNDIKKATETYLNKYLKVSGRLRKISKDKVILEYIDSDKKYNATIECNTLNNKKLKKGQDITIVGTLYNYENDKDLKLSMKNCYLK